MFSQTCAQASRSSRRQPAWQRTATTPSRNAWLGDLADAIASSALALRPFSDGVIPTAFDRTLSPEGTHIMSLFTQWVPSEWAAEPHPEELEKYADRVIDTYNEVATRPRRLPNPGPGLYTAAPGTAAAPMAAAAPAPRPTCHSNCIHTTHPFTTIFIEITARRIGRSSPGSRVGHDREGFCYLCD